MPDSWLDEWETSLKRVLAMDWDMLIPGHPGPGGRLGNKQDVENLLQYMTDLADRLLHHPAPPLRLLVVERQNGAGEFFIQRPAMMFVRAAVASARSTSR